MKVSEYDGGDSKFIDSLGGYETFVPQWGNIVRARYPKGDERNYWHEKRFANSSRLGLEYEGIEEIHGVDFLHTIIPQIIEERKREAVRRKVAVLDIGSGLGFLGDQIRHMYPQVDVFGTSLANTRALKKKRRIVEGIRESKFDIGIREVKEVSIPEEVSKRVLESIGRFKEKDSRRLLHPDDVKWRSVLELTNYPEFDLEIDTYGELYYSDTLFPTVLDCAIKKLQKHGRLYIGDLCRPGTQETATRKFDQVEWFMKNKDLLSQQHGLEIFAHHNDVYTSTAHKEQTTSVVIRKFK